MHKTNYLTEWRTHTDVRFLFLHFWKAEILFWHGSQLFIIFFYHPKRHQQRWNFWFSYNFGAITHCSCFILQSDRKLKEDIEEQTISSFHCLNWKENRTGGIKTQIYLSNHFEKSEKWEELLIHNTAQDTEKSFYTLIQVFIEHPLCYRSCEVLWHGMLDPAL